MSDQRQEVGLNLERLESNRLVLRMKAKVGRGDPLSRQRANRRAYFGMHPATFLPARLNPFRHRRHQSKMSNSSNKLESAAA